MKFSALLFISAIAAASPLLAGFSANLATNEAQIVVESDLDRVKLGIDFNITLSVTCGAGRSVAIPDISEIRKRFQGFSLAEGFACEKETLADGAIRQSQRWRLIPEPGAERYRLGAFAFVVSDTIGSANKRSYPTKPVFFPVEVLDDAAGDVEITPEPYWIPPTLKMVVIWTLLAIGAVGVIILLYFLIRQIKHQVRLHKMTPSERALTELNELLSENLPARGLFKDYYILLTRIVRRYIGRAHGIKAPEQTTEEFLLAASENPHFTEKAVATLTAFLQSADLVKFAGRESDAVVADGAAATARDYIKCDAEECRKEAESVKGAR